MPATRPSSAMLRPDDQTATIDALARGVEAGDPVAVKVLGKTARYLGAAVANVINLVNPEVIVLSSWVAARLGEPLLSEVRAAAARHALSRPLASSDIVRSRLTGNPVSLGAATLALEGLVSKIGLARR